uniref:Cytochrome P450 n=1 Tax=Rhabditophanes sp. KR3021 TaxID=114890 RepID=A0AC35UGC5_9BILA
MISLPLIIALVIIFLAFNFKSWSNKFKEWRRKHMLGDKLPGPGGQVFFLGHMYKLSKDTEISMLYFDGEVEKVRKQGHSIARIWMGENLLVIPFTPDSVKEILEDNDEITKGDGYELISKWLGNDSLLTSTGEQWRQTRKLLTPAFHFSVLKDFIGDFNRETKILLSKFDEFADTGEEIDVSKFIKSASLDMVCSTAMGHKSNVQQNPECDYVVAMRGFHSILAIHSRNPFYRISNLIFNIFGEGKLLNKLIFKLKTFTKNIIDIKMAEYEKKKVVEQNRETKGPEDEFKKPKQNFITTLLQLNDKHITNDFLVNQVDTFVFAGVDTTSTAHGYLFWCLATHPEVQEKLYQEIYDVFGDSDRDIVHEDFAKFTYLDLCIKESMRLHPTVPFLLRKLENERVIMNKYHLPKGTDIMISPYYMNLNPDIYPNPLIFDPERFSIAEAAKRSPYSSINFSAGPRNCIGQKYAMQQLRLVAISLLRKFKISSSKPHDYMKHIPELVLNPKNGIPIIFNRRSTCDPIE